ncbi:DUF58 domain-containing protein [Alienimonas chondri]|uniref:DUF58 domain-containing protein n=1 Tax=Alienimonas chondri TaxID=2681879 RepID=UPI0019D59588|nr:DUF58 domain-containing protein [Alienimonas chondri]
MSLLSKRVFAGQLMAQKRTRQLGSGVEFADHRQYDPGDDFRHLDWNLYARHGELLLKRFQEEEDLHIYLLLDASRSMSSGTPPKFDLARRVVAALAYIALADLDRVAVVAFAGGVVEEFPLTRGKGRILALLRFLENLDAGGTDTNLSNLVGEFLLRGRRAGLAAVVSDFYDPAGFQAPLSKLRHAGHEPHAVQLYDAKEADPGFLGDVELTDVETGRTEKRTVTEKDLRRYREAFDGFQKELATLCKGRGWGHTVSRADAPFDDLVLAMMRGANLVSG